MGLAMKIHDISRELFSTGVYPGDPVPYSEVIRRMDAGDSCNLSGFFTGSHSATHMDAPRHFVIDGDTIDQLPLEQFIGKCTVVSVEGIVTGEQIDKLLPYCEKMVIFKGEGQAYLSQSAAFVLTDGGITLVGTDAQSIAPAGDERGPHSELLSAGIPILEGVDLTGIADCTYTLIALPLKLKGLEASPVRAVLIEDK